MKILHNTLVANDYIQLTEKIQYFSLEISFISIIKPDEINYITSITRCNDLGFDDKKQFDKYKETIGTDVLTVITRKDNSVILVKGLTPEQLTEYIFGSDITAQLAQFSQVEHAGIIFDFNVSTKNNGTQINIGYHITDVLDSASEDDKKYHEKGLKCWYNKFFNMTCFYLIHFEKIETDQELVQAICKIKQFLTEHNIK